MLKKTQDRTSLSSCKGNNSITTVKTTRLVYANMKENYVCVKIFLSAIKQHSK